MQVSRKPRDLGSDLRGCNVGSGGVDTGMVFSQELCSAFGLLDSVFSSSHGIVVKMRRCCGYKLRVQHQEAQVCDSYFPLVLSPSLSFLIPVPSFLMFDSYSVCVCV